MFNPSKPSASLSSGLLARKGQAKPAMRPQGFGGFGSISGGQDDLGWNDMGDAEPTPVAALIPPVLMQREVLREELTAPDVSEPAMIEPLRAAIKPVSVATATRIDGETAKQHKESHPKAAFTLRLDADRHLRLRLASALHNASAQTLVTEALDQFLHSLPEVDDLVRQIPARTPR